MFISCSGKDHSSNQTQASIPKALQKEGSSSLYKRGYENLVESLYNELSEDSLQFKELNKEILELGENEKDSTQDFIEFQGKNESYYKSAGDLLKQIKDSILRQKVQFLLNKSQSNYISQTTFDQSLLKEIISNRVSITDLHSALKIVSTIPLIEKYQSDQVPSNERLKNFRNEQKRTLDKLSSFLNKNGG